MALRNRRESPSRAHLAFDLDARKQLGQNFLKDIHAAQAIVDAALGACPERRCVEIGPGSGALTSLLLESGWDVLALEKDNRAVDGLRATLGIRFAESLRVIPGDVLDASPDVIGKGRLCLGNLPYYMTSDIVLWFCKFRSVFQGGIFMLQEEVVDRLAASPHTKAYGRLTVRVQLLFHVEKLFRVPREAFEPRPSVDSAVVKLTPREFRFASDSQDEDFSRFTAKLFSARRKMIRKTIADDVAALVKGDSVREHAFWQEVALHGITPEARPDALSPTALLELFLTLKPTLSIP